jgi:hypothetical protein
MYEPENKEKLDKSFVSRLEAIRASFLNSLDQKLNETGTYITQQTVKVSNRTQPKPRGFSTNERKRILAIRLIPGSHR